MISQKTSPR